VAAMSAADHQQHRRVPPAFAHTDFSENPTQSRGNR